MIPTIGLETKIPITPTTKPARSEIENEIKPRLVVINEGPERR